MARPVCANCKAQVVYDPDTGLLRPATEADSSRLCLNRPTRELSCNWLSYARDSMCYACELTGTIPVQAVKVNHSALRRFESAKRRLVAALLRMQLLPIHGSCGGMRLRFHLKQDRQDNPLLEDEAVMTGHVRGDITLNMRETDRARLAATRRQFREKYRTLLGTLRHEVGHYFFLAIVEPTTSRLAEFRDLFGDERVDYGEALARYHAVHHGPDRRRVEPPEQYISEYAQSHPHEDWAETWAHFMHMEDALAASSCLGLDYHLGSGGLDEFALMVQRWDRLTVIANAINLSMGHEPVYPFKLSPAVFTKMSFVAKVIAGAAGKPYSYSRTLGPPENQDTVPKELKYPS